MTTELNVTLMIIILCWILLTIADVAACVLLKLIAGIPFRKAFLLGLLSLLLPPVLIAYGSLVERNWFKVKEVTVTHSGLPEGFDGYRIVHISDIHGRSFAGREKHLQKAIAKINGLRPDIIAFTGDLITLAPDELDALTPALSSTEARDGIYSVLGNHDYSIYSNTDPKTREGHLEDLILKEKKTDDIGYLTWDMEQWSTVDGKRFIRTYQLEGRVLSEYTSHNIHDLNAYFLPDEAEAVQLS